MKVTVSLSRDGKELARQVVTNPKEGEIAAAISSVYASARAKVKGSSLWDCEINLRSED